MANMNWYNDLIQFPRLIAEISACVDIKEDDWNALCESMDLSTDELNELFDRAQVEWERIKNQANPEELKRRLG